MLARHHAAFGVLTSTVVVVATHAHPSIAVPAGVSIAVGSLLPDLDEPGSRVARTFPLLSSHVSTLVKLVAPKHRGGESHSLGTAVIVGTMLGLVSLTEVGRLIIGAIFGVLLLRAVLPRTLRRVLETIAFVPTFLVGVLGGVLGALLFQHGAAIAIGVGTALGIIVHVLTDLPTNSGVALLWPASRHRFAPNWFSTGSTTETIVGSVAWVLAIFIAIDAMSHGHFSAASFASSFHTITSKLGTKLGVEVKRVTDAVTRRTDHRTS